MEKQEDQIDTKKVKPLEAKACCGHDHEEPKDDGPSHLEQLSKVIDEFEKEVKELPFTSLRECIESLQDLFDMRIKWFQTLQL